MKNQIHILAPFLLADEGDWQAIDLYLQYSKTYAVSLWSAQAPNKVLALQYPIKEIKPYSGNMPNGGLLVIMGTNTVVGNWYDQAQFEKITLFHNQISPSTLYKALNRLSNYQHNRLTTKTNVDIIYASDLVKKYAGLPGNVRHSISSMSRFTPLAKTTLKSNDDFVVGRISADQLIKHHYSDIYVYKSLINSGVNVRIAGGTCLLPWFKYSTTVNKAKIDLLSTISQAETPQFYNSLDCFYYRVPNSVKEAFGLVIVEAMLSGLPVVCHHDVGASELIRHGVNGYTFQTKDEAIEIMNTLKENANLRKEIGMQASKLNEALLKTN